MSTKIPTFDEIANSCEWPDSGFMNHPLLIERLEEREGFVLDALEREKGEPTEIWVLTPDYTFGRFDMGQNTAIEMLATMSPNNIYFYCRGLS